MPLICAPRCIHALFIIMYSHGGPGGAGTNPSCRRYFNPDFYRIILFDQRGSGKSKPFDELEVCEEINM